MRTYLFVNRLAFTILATTCLLFCGCASETEKEDASKKVSTSLHVADSETKSDILGIDSIRDELETVQNQLDSTKKDLSAANGVITRLEKEAVDKDSEIAKLKTLIASETAKLRAVHDSLQALSGEKSTESDEPEKTAKESDPPAKTVTVNKPEINNSSSNHKPVLGPEPPKKRKP